jgi:hypothetical protein
LVKKDLIIKINLINNINTAGAQADPFFDPTLGLFDATV